MSIQPQSLFSALATLNIETATPVNYTKLAKTLNYVPVKTYKGKASSIPLKQGSQKFKESVYQEVLRRAQSKIDERNREIEAQRQIEEAKKAPKPKVKKTPILKEKILVQAMKQKFYSNYFYRYENNETLKDLYNAILANVDNGTFISVAFKNNDDNKYIWRSIKVDYLGSFSEFEEEFNKMIEGKSIGSDPISESEYTPDFNIFKIGELSIAQTGISDDILFNSKLIESKEGYCAYLSLLECGFDSKTVGIKPHELRDFNKLVEVIKTNKLPISVIANSFTLNKPYNLLAEGVEETQITIKSKKREDKYRCIGIKQNEISLITLCEPEDDIETEHYLIYDEVNQHLDYIIGEPTLLTGLYLSRSYNVIKGDKIIFKPRQINQNSRKEKKSPVEFVFFDYETVIDFNASNCFKSYSLSILCLDGNKLNDLERLDKESRMKTVMSEEDNLNRELALSQIADIRKRHCITFLGYDCGVQFINWFLEYSLHKQLVFIGFNNTNFDNFLMLEDFLIYKENHTNCEIEISDIFYNGSQLLNFKIEGRHVFFDIKKHLVGSLKKNCEAFKIESCAKKECDHNYIQELHDKGELINYINTSPLLKEYNEYDVLATAVLYKRYEQALDAIEATKPYSSKLYSIKTIGSLIYKVFEDNKKKLGFSLPKLEFEQYNDLQKSKIAGRVELFNGVQKVEERLASTDVCSLYPFVMSVLNCYYPCGDKLIEVDSYKGDDELGFYYCDIDQSNLREQNLPNIYAKKSDVENDWSYTGVLENYLISNVMIGLLKKHNCKVVIRNGFIFPQKKKSCEMFGFLLDFMKEKNNQDKLSKSKDEEESKLYNPALRETLKLLMNSLSGKVIEGLHTEKTVDVDTVDEYLKIKDKATSINFINAVGGKLFLTYEIDAESICAKQQRPIYLGVLIYDYAKRFMFENSYSKIGKDRLLYTDTDASKFRYSDFIKWKKWVDDNNVQVPHWEEVEVIDPRYKNHKIYQSDSKVFGSFEDELEDYVGEEYKFYCVEKKSWCYAWLKDGKWKAKYRFKGLNGSAQLLSLQEPFIESYIVKHRATDTTEYREEIKHRIKPDSEYEVYKYYLAHRENNIENGNELKFFESVYKTGKACVLNSSFRKIVKNSARQVELEDTNSYNSLMNKIQVCYNIKKISIYK